MALLNKSIISAIDSGLVAWYGKSLYDKTGRTNKWKKIGALQTFPDVAEGMSVFMHELRARLVATGPFSAEHLSGPKSPNGCMPLLSLPTSEYLRRGFY